MATPSISEDWEEISESQSIYNDDNFSVHSIATSADAPSICNPDSGDVGNRCENQQALSYHLKDGSGDAIMDFRMPTVQAANDADADSVCSDRTTINDLLDIDVDPALLLSSTSTVRDTLTDVVSSAADLFKSTKCSTTEKLEKECQEIISQLNELEGILACYARSWDSQGNNADVPINPALHKWINDLMFIALGLQSELEDVIKTVESSPNTDGATLSLEGYYDSIHEFRTEIESFFPIMVVDLCEFQTQQLRFPTESAEPLFPSTAQICREYLNEELPPDDPISLLRSMLYTLKDNLHTSNQRIENCRTAVRSDTLQVINYLQIEQSAALNTLTLLLTHNGSEWIDHALTGGLSYVEFSNLDLDVIRDITLQVQSMAGQFNTAGMLPRHVMVDNQHEFNFQLNISDSRVATTREYVKLLNRKLKTPISYNGDIPSFGF